MRTPILAPASRFAISLSLAALGPSAFAAAKPSPVVVELFTAEGCVACPEADSFVNALTDRQGVIALTFPVDYWDYVGWKDTFAQAGFTDRQRAYANRMKVRELYTPEVVIQGDQEASGLDHDSVAKLIKSDATVFRGAPQVRFLHSGDRVEVGAGRAPARGVDVWLVRYDPADHEVRVKAGENKGKVVTVRNVVREFVKLGSWSGEKRVYAVPKPQIDGLNSVILVQGAGGGRILAATAKKA